MNIHPESKRAVTPDNTRFLKFIRYFAFALLSMIVVLNVRGQTLAPATTRSTADNDFIVAAAQGGMTEVELGALATHNGKRDDVKQFGEMMVTDHTAINDNLKELAVLKGVNWPDSLDVKHQAMVNKMAGLTGSQFDDAYITGMIKGHQKDAKAFKAESAATQDAEVKAFVDKSIPVVEEHLKMIAAMKK